MFKIRLYLCKAGSFRHMDGASGLLQIQPYFCCQYMEQVVLMHQFYQRLVSIKVREAFIYLFWQAQLVGTIFFLKMSNQLIQNEIKHIFLCIRIPEYVPVSVRPGLLIMAMQQRSMAGISILK